VVMRRDVVVNAVAIRHADLSRRASVLTMAVVASHREREDRDQVFQEVKEVSVNPAEGISSLLVAVRNRAQPRQAQAVTHDQVGKMFVAAVVVAALAVLVAEDLAQHQGEAAVALAPRQALSPNLVVLEVPHADPVILASNSSQA